MTEAIIAFFLFIGINIVILAAKNVKFG